MIADEVARLLQDRTDAAHPHLGARFQVNVVLAPTQDGGGLVVAEVMCRARAALLGQWLWDVVQCPLDALLEELSTPEGVQRCTFDIVQRVEATRAQQRGLT